MKGLNTKVSKKVFIVIIAIILILSGGITTGVILMNNNKDNQKQGEKQKDTILLKEDLKFEINSEVNLLSLVSEDNKVKVLSEDETIDTSNLGEKEITIKYEVEEKEETETFKITIVDTQAPTIEYKKELSTNVGTKIDLLKDVKISDNSKEEVKATIEGDYNFDNEGTYNLKYVAIDSSNNKKEEEFILKVNKKTTPSSNGGTSKPKPNNNNNTSTSNNTNNNENNSTKPSNQPNNQTIQDGNSYERATEIYNKYKDIYFYKYTTTPTSFSPEKYVTITTVKNPVKFHYEWFISKQKWEFIDDSGYIGNYKGCMELYPAPTREGKEISYEENGITYYTGEKTKIYQAYRYQVIYDDGHNKFY